MQQQSLTGNPSAIQIYAKLLYFLNNSINKKFATGPCEGIITLGYVRLWNRGLWLPAFQYRR